MAFKYATPKALFTAICDAIRTKTNTTDPIAHEDIPDAIDAIQTGAAIDNPYIEMVPSKSSGFVDTAIMHGFDEIPKHCFYVGTRSSVATGISSDHMYGVLKNVDLTDCNISIIPSYCFYNCAYLESVSANTDITTIENYAFYGCEKLNSQSWMRDVKMIKSYVFHNAFTSNTQAILYFDKCNTIGTYAFYYCKAKEIYMPIVKYIPQDAFNSSGFSYFDLPSVTKVAKNAFKNCTNLTSINLPSVDEITNGTSNVSTFGGCTALKSATFGSVDHAVTLIQQYTFVSCTSLETINIYIADGKTSLSNAPFGCTNTNLTINYYNAATGELISTINPNA